ncbi:MAG: radical SAM protein [Acidobacteriota bacterium]|nr:radical SAM protein [Acidobacteriota bacterium]
MDADNLDLSFKTFNEALTPETVITSVPDLYLSPRDQRVLLVEPETASWLILPRVEFGFLVKRGLMKPDSDGRSWRKLGEISSDLNSESAHQLRSCLYRLFIKDMITINGYSYHQPSTLWAIQRYPHYFNLHLTESCNLACRYCRVNHNGPELMMMSAETCKRIIRRVLEEIPGEKCIIGFHGGEPLLNIDCVLEGSKYAREVASSLGKSVTLSLQTNGLLLAKYSQLLKELKVDVGISIDGAEEIHNRYRVFRSGRGSFDEVMSGIQSAHQAGLSTGYLAVIHDPENYLPVARFMTESLKARSFRLNFSCYEGRAKKELDFDPGRAAEFARHWLELVDFAREDHQLNGDWLSIDDLNVFMAHLVSKDRPQMCYRSPCGAGNAILGFGHDGKIYLCEELVGKEEFCLGDINDAPRLTQLLDESEICARVKEKRKVENVAACADCPWKRFHGAGCLNKGFEFFGDLEHRDAMCYFYRTIFEELIWKLTDNRELVNLINYYKKYIKIENGWLD